MNHVFKCPAIIPDHGLKSMSDKGVRIMVDTQELMPEDMAKLFMLKGKFGYFYFAEAPMKESEIDVPDFTPEFKEEKSPSRRLRAVLYRRWEQSNVNMDFEVYYRSKMDTIINQIKDKLE